MVVWQVLCFLSFACSLGGHWSPWGGGWVEFVTMTCFVTTLLWFILHLLLSRLPRILVSKPWVSNRNVPIIVTLPVDVVRAVQWCRWNEMKWNEKCNDLKCVQRPTQSRLSLTHHTPYRCTPRAWISSDFAQFVALDPAVIRIMSFTKELQKFSGPSHTPPPLVRQMWKWDCICE